MSTPITPEMIKRNEDIRATYLYLKSKGKYAYTKTAKIFGISRQRVYQIVEEKNSVMKTLGAKNYRYFMLRKPLCETCGKKSQRLLIRDGNPENLNYENIGSYCNKHGIDQLVKRRWDSLPKNCNSCNRPLAEIGVGLVRRGICQTCESVIAGRTTGKFLLGHQRFCVGCGLKFNHKIKKLINRGHSLCTRCYSAARYHLQSKQKEYQKNYYHNRWYNEPGYKEYKMQSARQRIIKMLMYDKDIYT